MRVFTYPILFRNFIPCLFLYPPCFVPPQNERNQYQIERNRENIERQSRNIERQARRIERNREKSKRLKEIQRNQGLPRPTNSGGYKTGRYRKRQMVLELQNRKPWQCFGAASNIQRLFYSGPLQGYMAQVVKNGSRAFPGRPLKNNIGRQCG